MKKQIEAVEAFHNAFGQDNGKYPRSLTTEEYELRHALMQEENDEYLDACDENSLVDIADALGDQLYILCGTILRHGMQHIIEDVFDEIQASNMSKLGEDGKPVLREDGKILKGPGFFKPDLNKFIKEE
jgi:predicted HAD superfamily Cof-like phosphohydrolase